MSQTSPRDEFPLQRAPAEIRFAEELARLREADDWPRPPGWQLSPRAVRSFIVGGEFVPASSAAPKPKGKARRKAENDPLTLSRKFYGDDPLVDRAIVTLMSNRGLLLVGDPGTAKSLLSELLAAAISGTSRWTIQGTAATTEDQVKYSWNYALLLAAGPSRKSLVPGPVLNALERGAIVRFEEMTRCPPELQDTLISVLSERVIVIPELQDDGSNIYARPGFNIVGTANTRDRGVHEMSSALKRRFNFVTVKPIADREFELQLVLDQSASLLKEAGASLTLDPDVIRVLVTTFSELRQGTTEEGLTLERPRAVLSTAEAVAVTYAAGLDAYYYGEQFVSGEHLARQLVGTVLQDSEEDLQRVRTYFASVVRGRSKANDHWKSFYDGSGPLRMEP